MTEKMDKRNYDYAENDDFSEQYYRQLSEFSEMDNTNYLDSDVDFEFEQYPMHRGDQTERDMRRQVPRRESYEQRPRQSEYHTQRQRQPEPQMRSNRMQPTSAKGGKQRVEKKKKSTLKRVLIAILSIVTALFVIFNIVLFVLVGKVNYVDTGKRDDSIKAAFSSKNVKNILLIGSDTRDMEAKGRTDVMMVMSINSDKKEITLISLMRDMYVPLVGYYNDGTKMYNDEEPDGLYRNKLNSAYVFGGAELLMDTIKYNFGLDIDDYIYFDFSSFVSIVDALGSINIEITDEEAEGMNVCLKEQNRVLGNEQTKDYLQKGGKLELNGNQALAFARLRYVGNADFQRTQRQRIVINKIFEKVKDVGIFKKYSFLRTLLSNLTTNMSKSDLFFYGYKAPFLLGYKIKELRIPADGDYEFGSHGGQSTLDVDTEKCRKLIQQNIYS